MQHLLTVPEGTKSLTSFTAWTTVVSNPVCVPTLSHLSVSLCPGAAFATGIPPDLYAFHRYTEFYPLYKTLACQFRMQFPG